MAEDGESDVPEWMLRYPPPDITPEEFEQFVVDVLDSVDPKPEGYRVQFHDEIKGFDGSFVFDATVRFRVAGAEFLTVIEAKRHRHPIKRELIQALHSKAQSVGAHKAIMVSTARYQKGALAFAKVHAIGLVSLTEGRFIYETRAATPAPALSREEATQRFDLPTFVGHSFSAGDSPGSTQVILISTSSPEYVRDLILNPIKAGPE